jgi:hypothetical protein
VRKIIIRERKRIIRERKRIIRQRKRIIMSTGSFPGSWSPYTNHRIKINKEGHAFFCRWNRHHPIPTLILYKAKALHRGRGLKREKKDYKREEEKDYKRDKNDYKREEKDYKRERKIIIRERKVIVRERKRII